MDDPNANRSSARSVVGSALRKIGLHSVTVRFARREALKAERRRESSWRAAVDNELSSRERPALLVGQTDAAAVPVIVCLWNRPDRLAALLAQLSAQTAGPPVRLILWNNANEHSEDYRREIAAWGAQGALASVEFYAPGSNIGGIARFIVARHLRDDGYDGPFITLDDDENISPSFVRDLLAAHRPDGIAGWWAFRSDQHYWDRVAAAPGDAVTYVGTGGAVFDTSIVSDPRFFSELPARYGFLEDIWASAWVLRHGGRLDKVETHIEFVQEELGQYHDLGNLKVEFTQYLAGR
jgi:hypothetical protein